ncbi:MAG: thioredoxin domain-containing protein [Sedimenticolaceae bacterium]
MLARLFLFLFLSPAAFGLTNQLENHPSPYLALHGSDPVAWQDWDAKVLEKAQADDKLILISSGYFACHWCHVMQKESFKDKEIAALMNKHYIPVKLDRELHSALDDYLMDYTERTNGQAGWPLTVFLTPEGYPLIGATYMQPDQFQQVLQKLQLTWDSERDKTRELARRATLALSANAQNTAEPVMNFPQIAQRYLQQIMMVADPLAGGIGHESKFPLEAQLLAVLTLRASLPIEVPGLDQWVELTLDNMAKFGMRDHLKEGFFRYTVDPSWEVPHFEKMLYNQAQLARVYLMAGQIYGREDYLGMARLALDFATSDMREQKGQYISSLSAIDENDIEGGSYLWTDEELLAQLGREDAELAKAYWSMQGFAALPAGFLPMQGESVAALAEKSGVTEVQMFERLAQIKNTLLQRRAIRMPPRDEKVLAAWNGLMLGSLALAAQQFPESDYAAQASELAYGLRDRLWQNGRLWRSEEAGQAVGQTGLDDYAYLIQGLDYLSYISSDPVLIEWRDQLIQQAWQRFYGASGWRKTDQQLLPGLGATPAHADASLISASATLIRVSLRSADPQIREMAIEAAQRARPMTQAEPYTYVSHLLALGEIPPSVQ